MKNDDTRYGGCTTQCKYGPYCGDGKKNGGEDHVTHARKATPG